MVTGTVALSDGNYTLRCSASAVGVAVGKAVIAGVVRSANAGGRCLHKSIVAIACKSCHKLIGSCFCLVPEAFVIGLTITDILAHCLPVLSRGVPGSIGIEGGGCGKAEDAEFQAQGGSLGESSVVNCRYGPGQIFGSLVTEIHYEVDGFLERVAWKLHLFVGLDRVVQKRNTAHITDHICISHGYTHLGFCHLAAKLGCIVILGICRNPASILQEEPAITDSIIVLFAAKAVSFATCSVPGDIGAKCASIIKVVGTVTFCVLVGNKVVGDGLQDILSHFAVKIGDKSVRQVVVCRCQHFVCVLYGCKQGVYGGAGRFRGLTQTCITEFEAFA